MNRTARLLAIILAVVLVGGGLYFAYQSGYDAGALAATTVGEDGGRTVVVDPGWGRRGGYGFFPFFPLFFPFLFIFVLFVLFRPWRHGGPGRWSYGPGWGPPEHVRDRMEEWHRRAHEAPAHEEK